jgi:predicted HAD superfamily Cof-like phosphohydrolase
MVDGTYALDFGPNTLGQTALWFERAVPKPTSKNLHTQLGCHFEEVAEMVEVLLPAAATRPLGVQLDLALRVLKSIAAQLKASDTVLNVGSVNEIGLLDALCDQIVTATGVGHMTGFSVVSALTEVNRSNWSKFVDGQPVFDENQKIQKGPDYSKPQLASFTKSSPSEVQTQTGAP